jgi:hypothetical protein
MKTLTQSRRLRLAIWAVAIATLVPSVAMVASTNAGAAGYRRYYPGYHGAYQRYHLLKLNNTGSKTAIRSALNPCGLGWHIGGDGKCHIN